MSMTLDDMSARYATDDMKQAGEKVPRFIVSADGIRVVLQPDFRFDGAPDPKLGFGGNGYDKSSRFSALKSNGGEPAYRIPPSLDPAGYNEFWIWCQRYSVPLGVATLK
jgi:hypothetical protein